MTGLTASATRFEDDFKRVAIPKLEDVVRHHAFQIAIARSFHEDDVTWGDHDAAINRAASQMGSGRLPARIQTDLSDWIGRTLLVEVDLAEARVVRLRAQGDAAQSTPDRAVAYWKWLIDGTSEGNRRAVESVAIALSPAYRAYWNRLQNQAHGSLADRRRQFANSLSLQAEWRIKLERMRAGAGGAP